MQFTQTIMMLFLGALAHGAAIPAPEPAGELVRRKLVNDCGQSTFTDKTSSASPLVSDCQQIAKNIAGGGTWTVGAGGEHHQLLQYGTCAFGAQGDGSSANAAYIGNADIIDVINDSISKFQWEGKIGATGEFGCQSLKGLVSGQDMIWGIYHN